MEKTIYDVVINSSRCGLNLIHAKYMHLLHNICHEPVLFILNFQALPLWQKPFCATALMKYDVSDSAIVLPLSNNRTCEDDRISQYWITVNGSVIRVMQGNYGAQWRINVDFNSLRSGDTYIRQRSGSSLVQVIAWRLLGAKLLPEPMMTSNWHTGTNFTEIWINIQ